MTTRKFFSILVRRWYVVAIGLALTLAACGLLVARPTTTYWARTSVTILEPGANPLRTDGTRLAGLASALVIRVNGATAHIKTSSPETTLYGEGVLDGMRVRLRDVGRQWSTSIPDPILDVEATGADPRVVADRVDGLVEKIATNLWDLQSGLNVARPDAAFLRVEPDRPNVVLVGGSRARAVAATSILGVLVTGVLAYLLDVRLSRSPRRQEDGELGVAATPDSSST